jgi:hypothetical protein
MKLDPETYYRQLGRLIETMPSFDGRSAFSVEEHQWLGRADALIGQSGDVIDKVDWRHAISKLPSEIFFTTSLEEMRAILYRVLARAELKAPAGVGGAFIPVGNSFDAFTALSKLLQTATTDVMVVDPYMDETALTEFGTTVPEGVTLRLLSDQANCKASLAPAASNWVAQYGVQRPLAVRLAPARALHDRAIFIDQTSAWTLTQSLKDFAKRSPAEIVRADDTAKLKIDAYESIWSSAQVVV